MPTIIQRNVRKVALGLIWVAGLASSSALAEPWVPGQSLPSLATFALEGTLPDLANKVVLVDFWASWCGPCKASFPVLDTLQKRYASQGFTVVGINVDEKRGAMETFLKTHSVSFPILRDARQKLVASAGIKGMPSSFIVDRKGIIRTVHAGFKGANTEAELIREIEELLK
jgi:thiol-disulfide isomerase/thioredoxin